MPFLAICAIVTVKAFPRDTESVIPADPQFMSYYQGAIYRYQHRLPKVSSGKPKSLFQQRSVVPENKEVPQF